MSTWCIYMLGSTRVHKCSHHPCMSEYNSKLWTLHIYACICICEACERCLLMEFGVMKIIEVDLIVVLIFYSFKDVFVSSWFYKMFLCEWIGLLNNYHNKIHDWNPHSLSWTLVSVVQLFQWVGSITALWPITVPCINQSAWACLLDQGTCLH